MRQSFATPNTLSLENTPEPVPGLVLPVYEDIHPIARPRPVLPHHPTTNTIAPTENAPGNNLGLLCFSIYETALICRSRVNPGRHALAGRHRLHVGVALDILGRS
jgi:hypothetical protein